MTQTQNINKSQITMKNEILSRQNDILNMRKTVALETYRPKTSYEALSLIFEWFHVDAEHNIKTHEITQYISYLNHCRLLYSTFVVYFKDIHYDWFKVSYDIHSWLKEEIAKANSELISHTKSKHSINGNCMICMDEEETSVNQCIKCKNLMCIDCHNEWYNNSKNNGCPACRHSDKIDIKYITLKDVDKNMLDFAYRANKSHEFDLTWGTRKFNNKSHLNYIHNILDGGNPDDDDDDDDYQPPHNTDTDTDSDSDDEE
jgi:hypothetical protein